MKKGLISVIVPVFNSQNSLDRCINSIIKQSYRDIELILVDDGSNDGSLDICNQYAKKDHRIKVFHKENGGVSSARNMGLRKAKGDYIAFVDADDYIDSEMYELLLGNMKKTKSDVGICNICYEDKKSRVLYDYNHDNFVFDKEDYPKNSYYNKSVSGYVWNKLYSRQLIFIKPDKPTSFDCTITIAEDSLFNYHIFNNCKNIKYSYINDKLYHYVLDEGGATMGRLNERKLSYFKAVEEEVHILKLNEIDSDFLKADYVINCIKTEIIMKELNMKLCKCFENICKLAKNYKKEINYSSISLKLRIKLFISIRLRFIYVLKIKINNEYY